LQTFCRLCSICEVFGGLMYKFILNIVTAFVLVACSTMTERGLTTVHKEELLALKSLPCESVAQKNVWEQKDFAFLCNMGAWGTISYIIYPNKDKIDGSVSKAKLMWKEYRHDGFFPSNRESVEIVLGRLADHFAPNHRVRMLSFASEISNYTFYTDYLKIKHETEYYKNTPEPYFLHEVWLENLQ